MELMKVLNFFYSSALSFLSSNLGTGGGRVGRSIRVILMINKLIFNHGDLKNCAFDGCAAKQEKIFNQHFPQK